MVDNNEDGERHFTKDDLRDLFTYEGNCVSDTHAMYDAVFFSGPHIQNFVTVKFLISRFKCKRCINNVQVKLPPDNSDCTSDLSQWYHCATNKSIPDTVLSQAWDVSKCVSFVFHHRSMAAEPVPISAEMAKSKEKNVKKYRDDDDDDDDEDYNADDDKDEDFAC